MNHMGSARGMFCFDIVGVNSALGIALVICRTLS